MDIRKVLDIISEAEKPLAKGMKVMTPAEFLQSQGIEPKSEEGVTEGEVISLKDNPATLKRLAKQWWNGNEQQHAQAQQMLEKMGWDIYEDDDNIVLSKDDQEHILPMDDLEGVAEGQLDELKKSTINNYISKSSAALRAGRKELPKKVPSWKVAAGKVNPNNELSKYAKIKAGDLQGVAEGEVVSMQARKTPLVVAGSPFNWNVYDLRTNKMVANVLGGDRRDNKLYEIRINKNGLPDRMLPTYVLTAGPDDNPPYKAYELVDTPERYGKIEKSPGPGGTTKLRPDQDDVLRHFFKVMGGGKYYGYDLDLVEEGLNQWDLVEKALGAKLMDTDTAMELDYTDWDPEDSSSIVYLGNKKPKPVDEAEKLKGVSQRSFDKDELIKYLDRVVGEPLLDKSGKPKVDKKGNPQFRSLKTKTDKYKYPYIHRSNVPIVNDDGKKYDLDKLAQMFSERPTKILKQNEKMQHSDGTASQFYNVGLPALTGLAVDEDKNEFVVINTCPGAGECKLVCYAMKGGYIQYPASNLSQTRLLNFLYNDPDGFMNMLESEIREFEAKNNKKNIKTIIRWHDAGDFFSEQYLDKAYNLAKKFPDVDFYAYTKLAKVAQGSKPDNFKINFSMGAQPSQEKKIDFAITKNSRIVPEVLFADALEKDENGKWQYKNPQAEKAVKDRIAIKYSLDPKSIITYDEMMKIPVDKSPDAKGKWNVIVKPGDGDDAANRNDVLSSLLLIH